MKLMSAHIEDLRSLYVSHLKKALDMEKKIVDALPEVIDNCTDSELVEGLRDHLQETKGHVALLENLIENIDGSVETESCKVTAALTTAAADTIKDVTDATVRDIALIGAAQQVEHHEIAVYGTLRRWADLLGLDSDARVLETIESQEIKADETLSDIAERVNLEAVHA